jgi:PIN domain nuclease of toxin-antitoxin system
LLDTHVLLWIADGAERLNAKTRAILADPLNDRIVSHVSLWEIAIKRSTGKLRVSEQDIDRAMKDMAVQELPIGRDHVTYVGGLPFYHRDPFDRLLIAQAQIENLIIATRDRYFTAYGVRLLPA